MCLCDRVLILSLSRIVIFNFGIVPTVFFIYIFLFHVYLYQCLFSVKCCTDIEFNADI